MDGNEYLVSVLVQHRLDEARRCAAEQALARSALAAKERAGFAFRALGRWGHSRAWLGRGRRVSLSGARPSA